MFNFHTTFAANSKVVEASALLQHYVADGRVEKIAASLAPSKPVYIKDAAGSFVALLTAALLSRGAHLVVMRDKEEAAYFYNDLVQLLGEKPVFFLPSSFKRSPEYAQPDTSSVILRTEALNRIADGGNPYIVVTYPEAVMEKCPSITHLQTSTLNIAKGDKLDLDFVTDVLIEYQFQRVDFVYEPGQYSVRGSIIDIYSFSN